MSNYLAKEWELHVGKRKSVRPDRTGREELKVQVSKGNQRCMLLRTWTLKAITGIEGAS